MLANIGLIVVLAVVSKIAYGVYKYFIRPGKNLKAYGKWAVVTGATDGIGKAYAFDMAKAGLNVLLISRTQSKLDDVKQELQQKYKVEVDTLAVDYSKFDLGSESYQKVAAKVRGLDVGVLINNVGMSYSYPKLFGELTDDLVQTLNVININSVVWMTKLVLPGMEERGRGAVINISSASALWASPLLAVYAASKAYVDEFTVSMARENPKIHFQVQMPMFVSTKLAKIRNASLTVPSPKAYTAAGMKAIGYESKISPYWSHALVCQIGNLIPEFIMSKVINSMHHGLRKRGLKKDAQNK